MLRSEITYPDDTTGISSFRLDRFTSQGPLQPMSKFQFIVSEFRFYIQIPHDLEARAAELYILFLSAV
jgi:hypothetical protein